VSHQTFFRYFHSRHSFSVQLAAFIPLLHHRLSLLPRYFLFFISSLSLSLSFSTCYTKMTTIVCVCECVYVPPQNLLRERESVTKSSSMFILKSCEISFFLTFRSPQQQQRCLTLSINHIFFLHSFLLSLALCICPINCT
jgi:hypothetical protein